MTLRSDIRQALAELELVSHAPTQSLGLVVPSSDEDRGGKRPPGSDGEWKPRMPKSPRREGDQQSERAWDQYEEEVSAWRASHHRRTVSYYQRELSRRGESQALLDDIRRTIGAWRRMSIPKGQPPEYGSPQWKRFVAESSEDAGELARLFHVTRRYINQVRQAYR